MLFFHFLHILVRNVIGHIVAAAFIIKYRKTFDNIKAFFGHNTGLVAFGNVVLRGRLFFPVCIHDDRAAAVFFCLIEMILYQGEDFIFLFFRIEEEFLFGQDLLVSVFIGQRLILNALKDAVFIAKQAHRCGSDLLIVEVFQSVFFHMGRDDIEGIGLFDLFKA